MNFSKFDTDLGWIIVGIILAGLLMLAVTL